MVCVKMPGVAAWTGSSTFQYWSLLFVFVFISGFLTVHISVFVFVTVFVFVYVFTYITTKSLGAPTGPDF